MTNKIVLLNPPELTEIITAAIVPVVRTEVELAVSRAGAKEYLTQTEVCQLTGWSRRQLGYKRSSGELPYLKRGRTVLYRTTDVYTWLEEGYVPGARHGHSIGSHTAIL